VKTLYTGIGGWADWQLPDATRQICPTRVPMSAYLTMYPASTGNVVPVMYRPEWPQR
jgi:hypothetical protein